ncbi:receptor-type tyrosine-protein phosphatase eta-like [Dendropsophus ebraccatus]|uniref:receptor-type tyrosine-protein phosphatase eta-like n=1 Tax=Dendropsophus ebraccatus TaxID=150705 RepID=UPI0038320F06
MLVNSLQISDITPSSVSLTWSNPDEYQTSYSYRVQTNVSSSSSLISNTIVTSELATISGLIPGETYTFMVYTRAADGLTESDPVSLSTCTVPGLVSSISLNNYNSSDTLGISWMSAEGIVDHYNVSITGAVSNTIQTTTTEVTVPGLLPGREYSVTVQTVSGSCSQTSAPVTEATCPTPPDGLTFHVIEAQSLTVSWLEPVNMNDVMKSYEIIFENSSGAWTVTSNTINVTLQNLISGTNYSISVVTVGVWGYRSSPLTTSVYTKPMSVKSLQISHVTSSSVSLTWGKPDEYQTSYSYRVQTNVSSSSSLISNTIVSNEAATILYLTPGETYTFMVYTRAANGLTKSDPVSLSTCTVPESIAVKLNNSQSVNTLGVTWTNSGGKVDYYNVSITGAVSNTIQTTTTEVTVPGLLPGREYSVTVQTVSGSCSQTSAPVTEATYPLNVDKINFNTIGTDAISLSLGEPASMNNVKKSYTITYGTSSDAWTVLSTTASATLQNLISGTNYSISVVTVGVRGYESSPLTTSVYTSLPDQPINIQASMSVSNGLMDITFPPFDSSSGPMVAYAVIITTEINGDRPPWGILSKTYDDFNNGLTNTYVTCIIEQSTAVRSERASDISVHVGDGTKTRSYVNGALDPKLQYRVSIAGFNDVTYDPNTDTITEEQSLVSYTQYTGSVSLTTTSATTTVSSVRPGPSYIGAIIGGVIGGVVVLSVLIGVGFWLCRRRQKEMFSCVLESRNYTTKNENYEALFEKLQADNNKGFILEFDSLQSVGALQSRSVSLKAANAGKNRKDATYPYDKSRVKLSTLENSSDGYINANYIPGCKSEKEFIAAQHPLPGTIRDFWHMIWEKRITTIVMLSHHLENYRVKEEEYWPKTEAKSFGNIIATFISEQIHNDWTIRDIMVTNSKESRQVRQFHFTEWHESCDMDERVALIQFVHTVRKYRKENSSNSPTLVHCRTGTGRSGVFIALNCVIDQLESNEKVDVYGTVYKMHLHRPLMLQTMVQYIFLHRCTLDIVRGQKDLRSSYYYQNANAEVLYEEIPFTDWTKPQVPVGEESYEQALSVLEPDYVVVL